MNLEELISLVFVSEAGGDLEASLKHLSGQSMPVLCCSRDPLDHKAVEFVRYCENNDGEWQCVSPSQVSTPWVLLLEHGEYVSSDEMKLLGEFVADGEEKIGKVNIERFVPAEEMERYKWVTTRNAFQDPSKEICKYFSSELRLVPSRYLAYMGAMGHGDNTAICFEILDDESTMKIVASDVLISRVFSKNENGTEKHVQALSPHWASREVGQQKSSKWAPNDRAIFLNGHQRYFDDTEFSARFFWPHSAYHTIRRDHIPSIIEGLKAGLCNERIVAWALTYLIFFRDLETASEIVRLMPSQWEKRVPVLMGPVGVIYLFRGEKEKALRTFYRAFELNPEAELEAWNLIKILILTDHWDQIEAVEQRYKEETGKDLEFHIADYVERNNLKGPSWNTTLSLCMVVRNEVAGLKRTLDSVQGLVDEMIIVDTGSSDDTRDIAKSYGAKVFGFEWSDDFAEARNFAIKNATCDYIFMLDGDEYLSPFHMLDYHVLKKTLPRDKPVALELSIGDVEYETDWLFLARNADNFRPEMASIRIFPRLDGMGYTGRICETIEESLKKNDVSVYAIDYTSVFVLHDKEGRCERIRRKSHIYFKEESTSPFFLLTAIQDFSFLGDKEKLIHWLQKFYDLHDDAEGKIRMGLKLAALLENDSPDEAENLFGRMLETAPDNRTLVRACCSFLIRNNRQEKIKDVPFELDVEWSPLEQLDRLEYNAFASLKHFEVGELGEAFDLLESVLQERPSNLFAQSIRFYYLLSMNKIEEGVAVLSDLFQLTSGSKELEVGSVFQLLNIIEEFSHNLYDRKCCKERALILRGAASLERNFEEKC